MSYADQLASLCADYPELAGLRELGSLDRVWSYLNSQGFDLLKMDSVAQDEFSHDLRIPFPRGFLAFGVT